MTTAGKLVRDRIPELFGGTARVMDEAEYRAALRAKVQEELAEYLAASDADAPEELADVLEVVHALAALHGLSPEALEHLRAEKAMRRGGFGGRLFWRAGG